MEKISKYILPYAPYIALTVFIKLAGAVLELFIPYFMETILDDVVPSGVSRMIFLYGGLMLFCAVGALLCNIIANRMSAISSGKITRKLRYDLFDRLERLSSGQLDRLTVPSAESRLTSDTYNVNQLLARVQRLGIRAPILLLGGVVMTLTMDPALALILVMLLPLIGIIVYVVTKRSVPLYKEEQNILDRVVRILQENITGVRVIKALSKTEYEKERFGGVNDELTAIDQKAGLITAATNPSTSLVLNLGLTLVVLVGAWRVADGNTQSGVIIAFLQYFVMILNAMLGITRIFVMWSKGEASAHRVAEVLAMPEDLLVEENKKEIHAENPPHIEFKNVSFSYTGAGNALENISFTLGRGESLGILGETGSGKTTVISLLMRFYDVSEGEILINGRNVKTIPRDELTSMFGAAFQNDFIMEGTVGDNICFFRDISPESVDNAARTSQAEDFIRDRGGMDSGVAVRGNNLSGGQKQRLLIARALAGDPEILILDDSSSALDYRTDAELRKALHRSFKDVTSVTIAQRVSSIRGCTKILVLSDGKAIGLGTHDELMKSCDEYRIIAEQQMGLAE